MTNTAGNNAYTTHRPFFSSSRTSFLVPENAPPLIQRYAWSGEDPIHQPIIDRYRAELGLSPEESPSDAQIKYVLAPAYLMPEQALNSERHDTPAYTAAMARWPDNRPLWPVLRTRAAREEFVRYIVNFDLTNCRPYAQGERRTTGVCQNFSRNAETFSNACQGYASQIFVRYTANGRLPQADMDRLAQFGRIYVTQVPRKFHIPIFMATVPGHAFNAIVVGADTRNLTDYLFLEPQNDNLFTSASTTFRTYVSEGILTIGRLAAFNAQGQYIEQTVQTFVQEPAGAFVNQPLTLSQRIALSRLLSAFAIADDAHAWRATIQQAGITLEDHLRREGQINSEANIVFAARFVVGRTFRRTPQAARETITTEIYVQMLGRTNLEARIRAALTATP